MKVQISKNVKKNKYKLKTKISNYLEDSRHYNTICDHVKIELYNPNIEFDKKDYYFQFNNCVYDLKNGCFKTPCKEDYIRTSCGYDYVRVYNEKKNEWTDKEYKKETQEIMDFIKSTVDDNTDFLLTYFASALHRYNTDQRSLFMLGTGRNGKGITNKLLIKALGNYYKNLSMSYFTTYEKSGDAPNANLFDCRDARFICSSEIDETNEKNTQEQMVASKFKMLTGQDEIKTRSPHDKKQISFYAGALCFQMNYLPKLPIDVGMRERVLIVDYKYNFVDNPKKPNEKKKDINLGEKFSKIEYRQAFIQLLFKYYKEYLTKGLVITESIKMKTEETFCEMNELETYLLGVNSPIEKSFGSKVWTSELFNIYKVDHQITTTVFGRELKKIKELNVMISGGYKYIKDYKFKDGVDDDDDIENK
jgi:phage/plasmid-associated DNA primase